MGMKITISEPELIGDKIPTGLSRKNKPSGFIGKTFHFIGKILNHKKHKVYMIPSLRYSENMHRQIEKYILLNNGSLKQNRPSWISEGQLFLKDHFWLAKEDSFFSFLFYSDPWTQVRHTYYVSSYNEDYFIIEWVSQRAESKNITIDFVPVPFMYDDNSIEKDSRIKI